MTLVERLLGYRTFSSEREIRRSIETSESCDSSGSRRTTPAVSRCPSPPAPASFQIR